MKEISLKRDQFEKLAEHKEMINQIITTKETEERMKMRKIECLLMLIIARRLEKTCPPEKLSILCFHPDQMDSGDFPDESMEAKERARDELFARLSARLDIKAVVALASAIIAYCLWEKVIILLIIQYK